MSKYITSTTGIMGGDPVIAGTRIPISRIIYLLSQGYTVKTIHEDYPWVTMHTLEGVIHEIIEIINNSPYVSKVSQIQTAS